MSDFNDDDFVHPSKISDNSDNSRENSGENSEEYEGVPKLKPILKCEKIHPRSDSIENVAIFLFINLVSASHDQSIVIFNNNIEIIQTIKNAHSSLIWDVQIKDEENFATCSTDNSIKFWKKNVAKNKFVLNETIEKAHSIVNKILYKENVNLISCSVDGTIKIWQEKYNQHHLVTKLNHLGGVQSILLCEDKNLLSI